MRATPSLGITLGDPAGIGPEIVVKTLSRCAALPPAAYIIFGSRRVLEDEQKALGLDLALKPLDPGATPPGPGLYFREAGPAGPVPAKGRPSAEGGRISFTAFEEAVGEAGRGGLSAVVTGPISKQAWEMAGLAWRGHTEYLETLYPRAIMAFWSNPLKVALLSHHLPLREALTRVRAGNLEDFFSVLGASLGRLGVDRFRFLVAGLNPHAGEGGLMGHEEEEIALAVRRARAAGLDIEGPFPPDTVFRRALGRERTMVVALYHDQGLIPFKLVAFESGVNVTLGLPFVRTSPDHGTAYDIAARRVADPGSFLQALRLAVELAEALLHLRP
jgi:4-hydroxythreonine-4-phosphate dehydrogenase